MIEFDNVTVHYQKLSKKHLVLDNVSLTIPENRNIAVFGTNNQDVSFLLKLITGSVSPQKGAVKTNQTFSWNVGLGNTLRPEMTVAQNVKFLARIYFKDSFRVAEVVYTIKQFTGMGKSFELPMRHLTPEMRSKLNRALVLFLGGQCLVLENMIANRKTAETEMFENLIKEKMEKEGCSILMTTPAINKVREFCNSGLVLHEGALSYFEDIAQAIEVFKEIKGKHK